MVEYRVDDTPTRCDINVLPAAVAFTGLVPDGKTVWNQAAETEMVNTVPAKVNYLRGRKLVGTDTLVDGEALLFEKDTSEGETRYKSVACSDEITTFDHQFRGTQENDQMRRIQEWMDISRVVNE